VRKAQKPALTLPKPQEEPLRKRQIGQPLLRSLLSLQAMQLKKHLKLSTLLLQV
jgi:hypothetical protein